MPSVLSQAIPLIRRDVTLCLTFFLLQLFPAVCHGEAEIAVSEVTTTGDLTLIGTNPDGVYMLALDKPSGRGTLALNYVDSLLDVSDSMLAGATLNNESSVVIDSLVSIHEGNSSTKRLESRNLVAPQSTEDLQIVLLRPHLAENTPWYKKLGKLNGYPDGHVSNWRKPNLSAITRVEIDLKWQNATVGERITISAPKTWGDYTFPQLKPSELPSPLVDQFGQLRGIDWDGKADGDTALSAEGARDLETFSSTTTLAGRSEFGGWKAGPQLEATGKFYATKRDDQWWLVDPEGYLFWSLGVTGVARGSSTVITDREALFADIEQFTDPDYRMDQRGDDTINYYIKNVKEKYGDDWESNNAEVTTGRMREWGLNTSGAWSNSAIHNSGRIPYTLIANSAYTSVDKLDKLPDPFSDAFRESLEQKLGALASEHADDPWLLGVFIDNELHWKRGVQIAEKVIELDYAVPAKLALLNFLKEKYTNIESLNRAWGTDFADFQAIKGYPDKETQSVNTDRANYQRAYFEAYYMACHEAMRRHFPGHLYLGTRFHYTYPVLIQVAAKYCDVLSFNIYQHRIENFNIPADIDKPFIISEFHFGAATPGVWGAGLSNAPNQLQQAEGFQAYVGDALRDARCVGAHWFCWADQPVTGRKDGENYRIGFVSIVDRPYPVLVDAAKETAQSMYSVRMESN